MPHAPRFSYGLFVHARRVLPHFLDSVSAGRSFRVPRSHQFHPAISLLSAPGAFLRWVFFSFPIQHRPPTRPRNVHKVFRRIHCPRPSNRRQQPPIIQAVAIRVASSQVETHLPSQLHGRERFGFSEHRFVQDPPRPSAVYFFEPRRDYANRCADSARAPLPFHPPPHCPPYPPHRPPL